MIAQIIIGLGFGDEGKGMLTDYLCREAERPLVVRFSGGHQAGHTVVTEDGQRHVFSNFGAGSLAGAPTFWSRYCTFHPIGYTNELAALRELDVDPKLYVDGKTAVTTPFDLLYNRARESRERHGSCGLGFGATVARHEGPHKLHLMDLLDDFILQQKLRSVETYYRTKLGASYDAKELGGWMNDFHAAVKVVRRHVHITSERAFFQAHANTFSHLIFEGSQGLLLDQEFGYFPHVTRAFTSSKNALRMLQRLVGSPSSYAPDERGPGGSGRLGDANRAIHTELHYVTRAYQTRHGNGPLSQENVAGLELTPTPYETNRYNDWQGGQRRALLDLDQLRYALRGDAHYSAGLPRHLTVSCLDHLKDKWRVMDGGESIALSGVRQLVHRLGGYWSGVKGNYSRQGNPVSRLPPVGNTLPIV